MYIPILGSWVVDQLTWPIPLRKTWVLLLFTEEYSKSKLGVILSTSWISVIFLASNWASDKALIGIGTDWAVSSLFLAVTTISSKTPPEASSSSAADPVNGIKKVNKRQKLKKCLKI